MLGRCYIGLRCVYTVMLGCCYVGLRRVYTVMLGLCRHMEDVHSATPALPLGTLFLII